MRKIVTHFQKLFMIMVFVGLATTISAQNTYYVNPLTGDDSRTSVEAQNQETPWATLNHAVSSAANFSTIRISGILTEDIPNSGANPGGGIYINSNLAIRGDGPGQTILQVSALPGNASNRALYIDEGVRVTLEDFTIKHGNTQYYGGGIYHAGASLTMDNMVIENNSAAAGGGIYCSSIANLTDVIVKNNTADSCGGIFLHSSAMGSFISSNITTSTISGNKTKGNGGGIGAVATDGTIIIVATQLEITGNSSTITFGTDTLKGGGGVYLTGEADFTLQTSTIDNNSSNGFGAGILVKNTMFGNMFSPEQCAITNNSAGKSGGGIAVVSNGMADLSQVTLSGNSAKNSGAGSYVQGGTLYLNYSTIANNTCDQDDDGIGDGGGIGVASGTASIGHTIISGNKDGSSTGNVYPNVWENGTITTNGYNFIGINEGSTTFTEGNPNADNDYVGTSTSPLSADIGDLADNGGYSKTHAILLGSVLIDAGNPSVANAPDNDQRGDGYPRIQDGDEDNSEVIDIGAYELPDPNSPKFITDSAVITTDSVVLYGTLIPNDKSIMNIVFEYGQNSGFLMQNVNGDPNTASGTDTIKIMATLNALNEGVTYYYRLAGDYNSTTYKGEEKSFTTFIDLSAVDINIRQKRIINTSEFMEYQINGGEWKECKWPVTENVTFEPGDVIVRQKDAPDNFRVVYTIDEPADAPVYSIDYVNEATNENVPWTDEYSTDNFISDINAGTNAVVELTVPDYGEDAGHLYLRTNATQYKLPSKSQDLVIPARHAAPIVSLNDKSSATAVFVKSADGTGDTVKTADGYVYTLNAGTNYSDILDNTTVDASGDQDIRVRIAATSSAFASMLTGDLDGPLDLTTVDVNVAQSILTNTLSIMEYSLNSSNGEDGNWYDCSNSSTTVTFVVGDVYVREAADTTNNRLVASITKQTTPSYTINYSDETTQEIVPSTDEYSLDNFVTDGTAGSSSVIDLTVPANGAADGHIYFKTKATKTQLASDVQDLVIPARLDAPTYSINYANETTNEVVPSTDQYSLDDFASTPSSGSGAVLKLTVIPENGEEAEHVYFRSRATSSAFMSAVQDLTIPARPAPPVVSLSDQSVADAVFNKSADGTGDPVTTSDGYEYSLDEGASWTAIEDATTVDATGEKNIIVRKKATTVAFASSSTSNLDGDLNLTNVGVNVAQNIITNTLNTMEYSLNSTDGTGGTWTACANGNTSVTFVEGKVYVREAANTNNNRLVITVTKATTPSYTVNYLEETTQQVVVSTDEYSYDNFATVGTAGAGEVLALTVPAAGNTPGHVYFKTKATAAQLASDVQDLVVPARPAAPSYTINYPDETTAETVPSTDVYSYDNFATAGTAGSGSVLDLTVPGNGEDNGHVYFRKKATSSTFLSAVQDLVIPAKAAAPIVSLDDNSSATAVFKKSADGTGDNVATADGYEYTLDNGTSWTGITDATTVDATGDQDIRARVKATSSAFASEITGNLDGALDLSPVTYNVAQGTLNNTLVTMEYSLNSTDGTDGTWSDCQNTSTSVTFTEGKVYVREKADATNLRLLGTVTKASTPSYTINYVDETTAEAVPSTDEYSLDNFATVGTSGTGNVVALSVPENSASDGHIYFRTKATASQLASGVQDLVIPARLDAPTYTISFENETTVEAVTSTDEYSTDNFATAGTIGSGTTVALNIPEYGQDNNHLFIRHRAINQFASAIQDLVITARSSMPIVSLSDQDSNTASFKKSADGTGEDVTDADNYEYSTDGGSSWNDITTGLTLDASGDKDIRVRKKATTTEFASSSTGNLDGPVDLTNVAIHVANGLILNTLTTIEYSVNSTNGTDGDWTACQNVETSAIFVAGPVYVREIADPSNIRLVATITKPDAPSAYTIDYVAETTNETVPNTQEYSFDAFSTSTPGSGTVISLNVPETGEAVATLEIRVKATASTLASDPVQVTVPARPGKPVVYLSDPNASDAKFVKTENGTDAVVAGDNLEYSLDEGNTWTTIDENTTVDATGDKNIIVRKAATSNSFASQPTGDLDNLTDNIISDSDVELIVFPNPTTGRITIKGIDNAHVIILDNTGRVISKVNLDINNPGIDLGQYQDGVYVLQVHSNEAIYHKKLLLIK